MSLINPYIYLFKGISLIQLFPKLGPACPSCDTCQLWRVLMQSWRVRLEPWRDSLYGPSTATDRLYTDTRQHYLGLLWSYFLVFTESTQCADSVIELQCPSVCLSVCLSEWCLWQFKTPTSLCPGDFQSKGISIILAYNDQFF